MQSRIECEGTRVRVTLEILDEENPVKSSVEGHVEGPIIWNSETVESSEDGWRTAMHTGRFNVRLDLKKVKTTKL